MTYVPEPDPGDERRTLPIESTSIWHMPYVAEPGPRVEQRTLRVEKRPFYVLCARAWTSRWRAFHVEERLPARPATPATNAVNAVGYVAPSPERLALPLPRDGRAPRRSAAAADLGARRLLGARLAQRRGHAFG